MSEMNPGAQPAPPLRVMLLDDDPFMLDLLHDMLNELGSFEVLRETCARSALRTLPANSPELLVCDLSLPEMDGIEFLQAAAGQGYGGRVILVSALEDGVRDAASELARALGLQVAGAFRKPLAIEQLRLAVQC